MEPKIRYQYTYFIYPFYVKEERYSKLILKLLKDKSTKMKIFEKEKDLNIYSYFVPQVRDYMFWSMEYNKFKFNKLNELDLETRATVLSKKPCIMFEYTLPGRNKKDKDKKIDDTGITFDTQKIELICFNNGVCFASIKTILNNNSRFSDVLNFNYKLPKMLEKIKDIDNQDNIKINNDDFNKCTELKKLISVLTRGIEVEKVKENYGTPEFYRYAYACLESENWNDNTDTDQIDMLFEKYFRFLPNDYNLEGRNIKEKNNFVGDWKYTKYACSNVGTVVLTSGNKTENYTKLPYIFENELYYSYIYTLYKYISLKKIDLDFNDGEKFLETKRKLIEFNKDVWINEGTIDKQGIELSNKWKDALDLKNIYMRIKYKYDVLCKNFYIAKNKKINFCIGLTLIIAVLANLINVISLAVMKG